MNSLLPPNATALERALESVTARIGEVPTPARDVWNPDTCPADLLPWLAWSLSIDAWKPYWPEHVKRSRIRSAIDIQRAKGTAQSVRDVVASFGGSVQLREWWQMEPPGRPHTFEMVLTLSGEGGETATARFVDDVIGEVSRTKPVRSHFTFTQGLQALGGVGIAAAARAAVYRRLQLQAVEP
ncbi:phage tail protein I [Vulcaniibacterium tengchongense]|uniref:Phage tail P2-like protein n=1 Tax=Vulcaniibacterium tengchongense TaxID=1273429 RepID=A0A3N4UV69_9GAMM|nr:phage tail protein I [Vulcaniibacterium tengchongense]RPE74626.1 phage tail P2-like protein [Vulcaniibacterium tengchongense]